MKNSKYSKEELENLILVQNMSYESIGKLYNCTGNNIKKVALRLGIELPQRRKVNSQETFNKGSGKRVYCKNCGKDISHKYNNIYCDINCKNQFEQKEKYEYFLTEPTEFQRANYTPK